jgi:hypothetical protein
MEGRRRLSAGATSNVRNPGVVGFTPRSCRVIQKAGPLPQGWPRLVFPDHVHGTRDIINANDISETQSTTANKRHTERGIG